jgi:hypothetical protein
VIKHENFNPRIIEWLSSDTRIKGTKASNYRVLFEEVLSNPAEIWAHAFENQISEASRNAILSLYSLGADAEVKLLEGVWSHHHRHKASKYNFRTTPGEFNRALKELDGAFLRYDQGRAAFLNPSIKDFLSSLLSSQPDFTVDLIETSDSFEQAARLWNLASLPAGIALRTALISREDTVSAVFQRLLPERVAQDPARSPFDPGNTPAESKARVMVELANVYRTDHAVALLQSSIDSLLKKWDNHAPDFEQTVSLLSDLENSKWREINKNLNLISLVKTRLLQELRQSAWAFDFISILEYQRASRRWSSKDTNIAKAGFQYYLKKTHSDERSQCTSSEELTSLQESISTIGSTYKVDVSDEIDALEEAIAEAVSEEQGEESESDEWREARRTALEKFLSEDEEVRRMFGSLTE